MLTSAVVIILYSAANFLCNLLRVSSVRDIVGTIIRTLVGLFNDIKASIMKLFPKLVGALTAKLSPFNNLFNINFALVKYTSGTYIIVGTPIITCAY